MAKMRCGVLTLVCFLLFSGSAFAAGFALIEQSVKGLGNAFAGGAAIADDPSTVFFNPAGMTRLEGTQVTGAVHVIMPSTKFQKSSATNVAGADFTGGNGGQGGVVGYAPNFYMTHSYNSGLSVGLGLNAPFGLATEYDRDWVGRYHAVESDVKTLNINPSIAYKVDDHLSVGAGVSAQYIDATLSSMVDAGLLVLGAASSQTADVFSEMKGDDWGMGYNLGLLYEFNQRTRVGASYRSKVVQRLKGDMTFTPTNATATALMAAFPNQGIHATINLPASAQASVYHQLNDQFALMADITWTRWSSFDKLVVNFDQGILGGAAMQSVTTESWKNNMRYSIGATFNPTSSCVLRTGVAYDQTPIPDAHRTPRIPGTDRTWVAIGAGHHIGNWSIDLAYAHLFVSNSKINQVIAVPAPTDENFSRGNLIGEFENSVDIASVEISYNF